MTMRSISGSRSGCLLVAALASAVVMDRANASMMVRDGVGGVRQNNLPGGVFYTGTPSSIRGSIGGSRASSMYVGAFDLSLNIGDGWQSFVTYCLEPTQPLRMSSPTGQGTPYEEESLVGYQGITQSEIDVLGKLWSNAYDLSLTARQYSAAFQTILWELAMDDQFDLGSGRFILGGTGYSGTVRTIGTSWMNNIRRGVWTQSVNLSILTNAGSQDLLRVVPVPLPGAVAMATLGLGVLATWQLRRRRSC